MAWQGTWRCKSQGKFDSKVLKIIEKGLQKRTNFVSFLFLFLIKRNAKGKKILTMF